MHVMDYLQNIMLKIFHIVFSAKRKTSHLLCRWRKWFGVIFDACIVLSLQWAKPWRRAEALLPETHTFVTSFFTTIVLFSEFIFVVFCNSWLSKYFGEILLAVTCRLSSVYSILTQLRFAFFTLFSLTLML